MDPTNAVARARAALAEERCETGDAELTRVGVAAARAAHESNNRKHRQMRDLDRDFGRWADAEGARVVDALRRRRHANEHARRLSAQPEFLLLAYAVERNIGLDRHWPGNVSRDILGEAMRAVFEEEIGDSYDEVAAALDALDQV